MNTIFFKKGNRIVLDLGKVAYAKLYWRNQFGHKRELCPEDDSYFTWMNNTMRKKDFLIWDTTKTFWEWAKEVGQYDTWIPCCHFQLSNGHSLTYEGREKATTMYEAWCKRIFSKKKGKK